MFVFKKEEQAEFSAVKRSKNAYVKTLGATLEDDFNYYMRMFILEPNGYISMHRHEKIFHLQYMLEGSMKVVIDSEEYLVSAGDVIYIPSKSKHKYINNSNERAVFLCITPLWEDKTEFVEE